MPADIRFPLERANGVQIVKTAAALARAGARTTLLVRHSDPAAHGRDPRPVRRRPASRPARAPPARAASARRLRAARARPSWPAPPWPRCPPCGAARSCSRATSSSRTCCSACPARPGWSTRPTRWSRSCTGSGARSTARGEAATRARRERLRGREGRVWRGAAAVVATTAGIRDSFAEAYGARPRVHVVPNGCDVPEAGVPRPARGRAAARPLRGPALSRGRAWTCWWRRWRRSRAAGS